MSFLSKTFHHIGKVISNVGKATDDLFHGDLKGIGDDAKGVVHEVKGELKDTGNAISDVGKYVVNTVKNIANNPAALAALALNFIVPGAGAALGGVLGFSGTAASIIGDSLIGGSLNAATGQSFLKGAINGAIGPAVQGLGIPGVAGISDPMAASALNSSLTGAARAALHGGNFNSILNSGLSGGLGSLGTYGGTALGNYLSDGAAPSMEEGSMAPGGSMYEAQGASASSDSGEDYGNEGHAYPTPDSTSTSPINATTGDGNSVLGSILGSLGGAAGSALGGSIIRNSDGSIDWGGTAGSVLGSIAGTGLDSAYNGAINGADLAGYGALLKGLTGYTDANMNPLEGQSLQTMSDDNKYTADTIHNFLPGFLQAGQQASQTGQQAASTLMDQGNGLYKYAQDLFDPNSGLITNAATQASNTAIDQVQRAHEAANMQAMARGAVPGSAGLYQPSALDALAVAGAGTLAGQNQYKTNVSLGTGVAQTAGSDLSQAAAAAANGQNAYTSTINAGTNALGLINTNDARLASSADQFNQTNLKYHDDTLSRQLMGMGLGMYAASHGYSPSGGWFGSAMGQAGLQYPSSYQVRQPGGQSGANFGSSFGSNLGASAGSALLKLANGWFSEPGTYGSQGSSGSSGTDEGSSWTGGDTGGWSSTEDQPEYGTA